MPQISVLERAIRRQVDFIGGYRQVCMTALDAEPSTSLWALFDGAQDQPYENRITGSKITILDTQLLEFRFGNGLRDWFGLHNDYYASDFGVSSVSSINTALSYYKWRVSEHFSELFKDYTGGYLSPANVYPRSGFQFGAFAYTSATFSPAANLDTLKVTSSVIILQATSVIGAANLVLNTTMVWPDDSTQSVQVTLPSGSAIGTAIRIGQRTLAANAAAGQKVVQIADTGPFKVGQRVLLENNDSDQEWGTVASITTNTSITLADNLRWNFTTATSSFVTPLFKDISAASASLGTNGDTANFMAYQDRVASLNPG